MEFLIHKGKPGQIAYFKIENVPASIHFRDNTIRQVDSVVAVKNTANSWFRSGTTLHIAAQLNGDDWSQTRAEFRFDW